jgi:hypothetical protein
MAPPKADAQGPVAALDDLLERGQAAKTRRDEAAEELRGVVQALDGLAKIGYLDDAHRRSLAQLKRPARRAGARRAARRRAPAKK